MTMENYILYIPHNVKYSLPIMKKIIILGFQKEENTEFSN